MIRKEAASHFSHGSRAVYRGLFRLIRQPVFLVLTVAGNSMILLVASIMYRLESGVNPHIHGYLDTLWWAVAAATTVGFGDASPVTSAGKLLGMAMMLFGSTLFCSFTALFASALLSPEIEEFEEELARDEDAIDLHLRRIESSLEQLRKRTGPRRSA